MKSLVVKKPQELVTEDRPMPEPGPHEVRIKVAACGVCFSDHLVTDAMWPGLELPRVPGHEIAGVIDALGDGVTQFRPGQAVGVGWHGGHDSGCDKCLAGDFMFCDQAQITGISFDGGYSEYVVVPAVAVARVPDGMNLVEAAPLLCAGVTTYNALRNSDARPGDVVGIQGLGGLGHLGVQFAKAMGFEVVAISRGADKEAHARELGAHHFIDAAVEDIATAMRRVGMARVILATAPNAKAISALVPGLGIGGSLIVVGAPFEPLTIGALDLISGNRRVQGWSSGTAIDSTETMAFAHRHGVKAMIERFPFADAKTAIERTMSGKVRFRSVLEM